MHHSGFPLLLNIVGIFERFLSLWVALAIAAGVALGALFPQVAQAVATLDVARINLPIALLIWGMIYPMMLAVDFGSIGALRRQPKGLVVTVVVNWLIKPLTMTVIAWLFIRGLFAAWIPAAMADQLHRRHDFAGSGAVHGHGVCVESPLCWRCQLHPGAGRDQ